MSYNGKRWAPTGMKTPHRQNRDLGSIHRWGLFGNPGHEISVNGEDGEKLLSKLTPTSS